MENMELVNVKNMKMNFPYFAVCKSGKLAGEKFTLTVVNQAGGDIHIDRNGKKMWIPLSNFVKNYEVYSPTVIPAKYTCLLETPEYMNRKMSL